MRDGATFKNACRTTTRPRVQTPGDSGPDDSPPSPRSSRPAWVTDFKRKKDFKWIWEIKLHEKYSLPLHLKSDDSDPLQLLYFVWQSLDMEPGWTKMIHLFCSKRQDYDLGIHFSSLVFDKGDLLTRLISNQRVQVVFLSQAPMGLGLPFPLS